MNNLKYFRKKSGKTQKDIADFLSITQTAYGNYELGKRQITPENLTKLADYYNVSVDDLLGRGSLDAAGKHLEEVPELVPEDEVMIPLVASLRCGPGGAGEPFTYIKPVPIPASYARRWGEGLAAIIAVGESMSPNIIPGDLLICRPGDEWVDQLINGDDTEFVQAYRQETEKDLQAIEKKINNVVSIILDHPSEALSQKLSELEGKQKVLQSRLKSLTERSAAALNPQDLYNSTLDLSNAILSVLRSPTASPDAKRNVLLNFIRSIVVDKKGNVIINYLPPGFAPKVVGVNNNRPSLKKENYEEVVGESPRNPEAPPVDIFSGLQHFGRIWR